MRKLTLNRDKLTELCPDDLRSVAAGREAAAATQPLLHCLLLSRVGCNTADSICELSQGC